MKSEEKVVVPHPRTGEAIRVEPSVVEEVVNAGGEVTDFIDLPKG